MCCELSFIHILFHVNMPGGYKSQTSGFVFAWLHLQRCCRLFENIEMHRDPWSALQDVQPLQSWKSEIILSNSAIENKYEWQQNARGKKTTTWWLKLDQILCCILMQHTLQCSISSYDWYAFRRSQLKYLLPWHSCIKLGQFNCEPTGCKILLFAREFAYWALHENGRPFRFDPQGDRLHSRSACWWRGHAG